MHQMRLRYGSTVLDLSCASAYVTEYVPQSPNLSVIDFNMEALGDGGERKFTSRRNVAETIGIVVAGSRQQDVLDRHDEFERVLRAADDWQRYHGGSPVYIEFQPGMDTSASWWRSEILDGKIQGEKEYLAWGQWRNAKVRYQIFWTRRFYWEGPELEVPIYNYHGGSAAGGATGGITLYNHDDQDPTRYFSHGQNFGCQVATTTTLYTVGEYKGFVWLDALLSSSRVLNPLTISGTVASTPVVASTFRVQAWITPTYQPWGISDAAGSIFIEGHRAGSLNAATGDWYVTLTNAPSADPHVFYDSAASYLPHTSWAAIAASNVLGSVPARPRVEITNTTNASDIGWIAYTAIAPYTASFPYTLQGEDVAWSAPGTGRTQGPLSGSAGLALPIPSADWTWLAHWSLTGSRLNTLEQRRYRVIANLTTVSASAWLKLEVHRDSAAYAKVLAETPEVQCASTQMTQDLGVLQLPPWGASATSVAPIVLVLLGRQPMGASGTLGLDALTLMPTDSWHVAEALVEGVAYNNTLKIDEMTEETWVSVGGSSAGTFTKSGALQLWPKRDQRFYLLWADQDGYAEPFKTSTVKIYYRPRRLGF